MEAITAKYWWQKGHGRKAIHWCSWRKMCELKQEGGLSFKNQAKFNVALLAKVWKEELIRNTFETNNVDRILQISLARDEHADIIIWRGEPSGIEICMKENLTQEQMQQISPNITFVNWMLAPNIATTSLKQKEMVYLMGEVPSYAQ
ncbi:hypothetical protein PVK06_023068 [Gossypium arboreum]|uniref:Uncharacterized protein n=1 Tax=Gossypium arboreum TaxID=29729 RepID=A0ABR0PA42_GOSAR|nr:hypothetical protein PVK06_023068 [Gossypium arboreum]